jgi:hypothetical protein
MLAKRIMMAELPPLLTELPPIAHRHARRNHLRAYGRPVTGDIYVAMADGPVPLRVYDIW